MKIKKAIVGDLELAPDYWDCECKSFYVHEKEVLHFCPECKMHKNDQPDSQWNEVVKVLEIQGLMKMPLISKARCKSVLLGDEGSIHSWNEKTIFMIPDNTNEITKPELRTLSATRKEKLKILDENQLWQEII